MSISIVKSQGDTSGFLRYIRSDQTNRVFFWLAGAISLILLLVFKSAYPYPNMVFDSYYYVRAASTDVDVNAWPIGYSKFLQFTGLITRSPLFLVCVQYLLLELSLLLLFFTIRFLFKPGRLISILLFIFLFANPLLIYTSNLVMADALFNGLSILWFTQLLWVLVQPRPYMIFTHAILLLAAFTVRYNALYYPLVTTFVFLLSRQNIWWKLAGIGLPAILLFIFITYTSYRMEAYCGARQFSAFGGWKFANNALYMYAHVRPSQPDITPIQFRALDRIVRSYFKASHYPGDLLAPDDFHGSLFMFRDGTPLKLYEYSLFGPDTCVIDFKKWSRMAPLYANYSSYLIRKYPGSFARWFIWPNLIRYAIPPKEVFMTITPYILREDELGPEVTRWFGITTLEVKPKYIDLRNKLIAPYPILFGLIHLCFLLSLLGFSLNKGWSRIDKPLRACLLTVFFFWLCDLGFSLTAAPIVLRYEIFPVILEFSFSLFFLEYIYRHADSSSPKPLSLPFQKSEHHEGLERIPGQE